MRCLERKTSYRKLYGKKFIAHGWICKDSQLLMTIFCVMLNRASRIYAQPKIDEEPKEVPDIGFKVFKLDSSNLKQ